MNNISDPNGNKNNVLKIVRSGSIGELSWDSSESTINSGNGINEWSQADLYNLLNSGLYWNRTSGNCYNGPNNATTTCDFSNNGLTADSKSMLYEAVWNTATMTDNWWTQNDEGKASYVYTDERGTFPVKYCTGSGCDGVVRQLTVNGKVGLIYPSDYGFATSGSDSLSRSQCLSIMIHSYQNGCYSKDWLYSSTPATWLITPRRRNYDNAFSIFSTGTLDDVYPAALSNGNNNITTSDARSVYPSVYLNTDVIIIRGTGTQADPYILQ